MTPHTIPVELHPADGSARTGGDGVAMTTSIKAPPSPIEVESQVDSVIPELVARRLEHIRKDLGDRARTPIAVAALERVAPLIRWADELVVLDDGTLAKLDHAADRARGIGHFIVERCVRSDVHTFGGLLAFRRYDNTEGQNAARTIARMLGLHLSWRESIRWTRRAAHVGEVLEDGGGVLLELVRLKSDLAAERHKLDGAHS